MSKRTIPFFWGLLLLFCFTLAFGSEVAQNALSPVVGIKENTEKIEPTASVDTTVEDTIHTLLFDDFETTQRTWRLAGDFLIGWGIVVPGNSSHTISRIEKANPLDSNSTKILKWQSKLGTKDIIAIDKNTHEKVISDYRFTQINTTPNMSGCDGISFQLRANKSVKVEIVASPAYAQIYNASVIAGTEWTTYTIPFSSFTPNEYWVPDNPIMQPEKIQVIGFEIAGTGVTYDIEIDNIKLYSAQPITRCITVSSDSNGSVTQSTGQTVTDSLVIAVGKTETINFVPEIGYTVFDVIIDGVHQGPISSYTFNRIREDHHVEVSFAKKGHLFWTITTPDSIAHKISPHGKVSVLDSGNRQFDFYPNPHERVKDVIVNGKSKGASSSYTFTNVTSNQTLDVKFELIQWNVTINTDENIVASKTGTHLVTDSTGFMVTFTPNSMYNIKDVIVNGVSQGSISEYIIPSVNMDYTIEVTSKPNLLIEDAEDGDNITNGGGEWYTYGDHLMPIPNFPGNSRSAISNVIDPTDSNNRTMVWDFKLGEIQAKNETGIDMGNWVGCGFGLAQFNLKGYKGITFRAKANRYFQGTVHVGCNETPYMKQVEFDREWKTYTLLFDEFTVSPWAPDPISPFSAELIKSIGLEFNDFMHKGRELQIAIDDIQAFTDSTVHIISAEAENGVIYPHGNNAVIEGFSQTYVMQTPANAVLTDVEVNGSSEGAVEEYTFENVTSAQSIKALFELPTYTLTASKIGEGIVSFLGDTTLNKGDSITYTFIAAEGYTLTDVLIDGKSQGAIAMYHFENVVKNTTIEVIFSSNALWDITTIADGNGSIIPGDTSVAHGSSITVIITPDSHHKIDDVLLNGVSQGAVSSLRLENIDTSQYVVAMFAPIMWNITATSNAFGTVTPADTSVIDGSSVTYTMIPDSNCIIFDVVVNGVSQGAVETYTFENISMHNSISAYFDIDTPLEDKDEAWKSGIVAVYPTIISSEENESIKFLYTADESANIDVAIFDKVGDMIFQQTYHHVSGNKKIFGEYKIDRALEKATYLAVFKISQGENVFLVKRLIGIKK